MRKHIGGENMLKVVTVENPISFNKNSKALTGQRDVDFKILSYLDDKSLLKFCLLGKRNNNINNLRNDNTFWRNRFIEKYQPSLEWIQTQNMPIWKLNYLKLRDYLDKAKREEIDEGENRENEKRDLNWALYYASKDGNFYLVSFLIDKGADDWFLGLKGAIETNNQFLVDFFYEKKKFTSWDYNSLMHFAAQAGNKQLFDYYIERGTNNYSWGIYGAFRENNLDMVKYIYEKIGGVKTLLYDTLKERMYEALKEYGEYNEIYLFYSNECTRKEEEMRQIWKKMEVEKRKIIRKINRKKSQKKDK